MRRPVALRPHLSMGLPLSGCVVEHNYIYGNTLNNISFFYSFFVFFNQHLRNIVGIMAIFKHTKKKTHFGAQGGFQSIRLEISLLSL